MNKTIALVFFVLTSLALGGLLALEKRQTAQQSAQIATLTVQGAEQSNEIQRTKAVTADLELKRAKLAAQAKAAKQADLEAHNSALPTPALAADSATPSPTPADRKKKSGSPFADSIAKMMKDPAMKDMMRTTQATALRQMYGDLVKQWALSPEETDTFYNLLLDKQMDQMDLGMNALQNGPDAAKTVAASAADMDAKIKASIGDDLYKQYQDYEKTIPAHMAVNQFQQQLAISNSPPMTPDQSRVLLQTISEEQASAQNGGMSALMGTNGNPFATDPAKMDQYFQAQSAMNDKIDARMANTLSPDQLQVYKQQQQQMLAMQRAGMQMASKMMAPSPTP